jgi:prophage tail gpP-like protein
MLSLLVDNKETSFLELRVSKDIDDFAGLFTAKVLAPIKVGTLIQIKLQGKYILEGFVEVSQCSLSSRGKEYQIQGREKTGDLVDSCLESTKSFSKKSLAAISQEYTKTFGIKVHAPDVLVSYTPNPGATIFKALSDLAIKSKLRVVTRGGEIHFDKIKPNQEVLYRFEEGKNILSAIYTDDSRERFKKYVGISTISSWETEPTKEISFLDDDIRRNRVLIFLGDENLKEKCLSQRNLRKGKAEIVSIVVHGYEHNGRIPDLLEAAQIKLSSFGLEKTLMIVGVSFQIDKEQKKVLKLKLAMPEAFKNEETKNCGAQDDICGEDN